jgi:hypothetical protein
VKENIQIAVIIDVGKRRASSINKRLPAFVGRGRMFGEHRVGQLAMHSEPQ